MQTLRLASRLHELERISGEVDAFARRNGIPPRLAFDANLALDEVLTNIISYAYDDEAEHEIVVTLRAERDRFVIEVEDDGRPFDPLATPAPDLTMPADERPVGGLGLSLVRRLMPELQYQRRDQRNVLTMSRAVGTEATQERHVPTSDGGSPASDVVVLHATGRLDAGEAAAFEQALLGRIEAGAQRIVVDCSNLEYINSAGLRALLVAAKRLSARSGAIALAATSDRIRSIIAMVGFDAVFPVCATTEQATTAVLAAAPRVG
ncbi:MAG TPA: anti-sigma factor antagonist [Candidatus Binatia bacterium]